MGLMIEGFQIEMPETNLLQVDVPEAPTFVGRLRDHGVVCFAIGPGRIRLVFHLDVGDEAVDGVIRAFGAARKG